MPDIRPVSELRNNFKAIEEALKTSGEPIFLTTNGRCNMVLVSTEFFDQHVPSAYGRMRAEELWADMKEPHAFGQVVTGARSFMRKSVEDVAQSSGVPVEMITQIESGDIKGENVPDDVLAALSRVLMIPVENMRAYAINRIGPGEYVVLNMFRRFGLVDGEPDE